MSDMVRKQIYITRVQEKLLKSKAAKMGVTEAELVREALDSQVYNIGYPQRSVEKWQEEVRFIEGRMTEKQDMGNQRAWKRDDLYDR